MDTLLDRTDLIILRHLQDNGRLSNAELADKANISPATCHRRTQRLFDDGYINSVRAQVNPQQLDLGALVIVGVVLDRSTPESFQNFEQAIQQLPFVLECQLVAGDFDYFLKVRVHDIADFNQLHSQQLITLPGVRQLRSFFTLKEVINDAPLHF
ncbi:MAG: Lrp/AsnC family transcriptional regulator [Cellvibrionaceae bacterium]